MSTLLSCHSSDNATSLPTTDPIPQPTTTATVIPWSAGQTFNQANTVAGNTVRSLFQTTVDSLIWGAMVVLPCLLPLIGLFWLASRLIHRLVPVLEASTGKHR